MSPIDVGQTVPHHRLIDLHNRTWRLPPPRLTHLLFRRFAGCPICNLHMANLAAHNNIIDESGAQTIAVFRATRDAMLPFQGDLPFPAVPDPDAHLGDAYSVRSSNGAVLAPRAMLSALRGLTKVGLTNPGSIKAAMLLPAEFLIAPDGRVLAAHRGTHAADHWSVPELLERIQHASSLLGRSQSERA